MNDIILKVDHLSKYFALVKALDDISFDVRRGEVHALCGENGAGKSTFIKLLTGAYEPTKGTIEFEHLKRMGVVLKRAHFFITCKGKMMYAVPLEETYIMRQLTDMNRKDNWQIQHQQDYQQMSLFDDFHLA